jgi:hypothetical protein
MHRQAFYELLYSVKQVEGPFNYDRLLLSFSTYRIIQWESIYVKYSWDLTN